MILTLEMASEIIDCDQFKLERNAVEPKWLVYKNSVVRKIIGTSVLCEISYATLLVSVSNLYGTFEHYNK